MIYEYPEEFIVPVVYVKDLKDKAIYRCKKPKSLHAGELLMPDEELQGDEIFIAEIDIYGDFKNENFLNIEEEILQESMIKSHMVEAGLEDENIKSILSDIDEDYANSETLNMKV